MANITAVGVIEVLDCVVITDPRGYVVSEQSECGAESFYAPAAVDLDSIKNIKEKK